MMRSLRSRLFFAALLGCAMAFSAPACAEGTPNGDDATLKMLRTLLADPDPDVRIIATLAAIKSGVPALQREAINAGIANGARAREDVKAAGSSWDAITREQARRREEARKEAALRGLLATTSIAALELVEPVPSGRRAFALTPRSVDIHTGRLQGTLDDGCGELDGQLMGVELAFRSTAGCNGALTWFADQRAFRGFVVNQHGEHAWVAWVPR